MSRRYRSPVLAFLTCVLVVALTLTPLQTAGAARTSTPNIPTASTSACAVEADRLAAANTAKAKAHKKLQAARTRDKRASAALLAATRAYKNAVSADASVSALDKAQARVKAAKRAKKASAAAVKRAVAKFRRATVAAATAQADYQACLDNSAAGEPVIADVPPIYAGGPFDVTVRTTDDRTGTWSITGAPAWMNVTGPRLRGQASVDLIGTYLLAVSFTDTQGRSVAAQVPVTVWPPRNPTPQAVYDVTPAAATYTPAASDVEAISVLTTSSYVPSVGTTPAANNPANTSATIPGLPTGVTGPQDVQVTLSGPSARTAALLQASDPFYAAPNPNAAPGTLREAGVSGTVVSTRTQGVDTVLTLAPGSYDEVFASRTVKATAAMGTRQLQQIAANANRAARADDQPIRYRLNRTGDGLSARAAAGLFECSNDDDNLIDSTELPIKVFLEFSDIQGHFVDEGAPTPRLEAWVTYKMAWRVEFTVAGAELDCESRPGALGTLPIPFPVPGVAGQIRPSVGFTLSASSYIGIERASGHLTGLAQDSEGETRFINDTYPLNANDIPADTYLPNGGDVTLAVRAELRGGFDIELGLGAPGALVAGVGVNASLLGFVELAAEATSSPDGFAGNVCLTFGMGLDLTVYAFLDLWFARWEPSHTFATFEWPLDANCILNDPPPVFIKTATNLPYGRLRQPYPYENPGSFAFATGDGRPGTWRVQEGFNLPPGLNLDAETGKLTGFPNESGRFEFDVSFQGFGVPTPETADQASFVLTVLNDRGLIEVRAQVPTVFRDRGCDGEPAIRTTTEGVIYTLTSFENLSGDWKVTAEAAPGYELIGQSMFSGSIPRDCATTEWDSVDTSGAQSCGIRADKTLWCWGSRLDGPSFASFDSTIDRRPRALGVGSWSKVSAGSTFSCGIRTDGANPGSLWCWGHVLGDRNRVSVDPVMIDPGPWANVGVGTNSGCAITTGGALACFGSNAFGEAGVDITGQRLAPTTPTGVPTSGWTHVAVGDFHTCATRNDATVWCTGQNQYGAVGNGDTSGSNVTRFTKVKEPTPGAFQGKVTSLDVGSRHSCVSAAGSGDGSSVWCWGPPVGGDYDASRPNAAKLYEFAGAVRVSAGAWHTCVYAGVGQNLAPVLSGAQVGCWGQAQFANAGFDVPQIAALPELVSDLGAGVPATGWRSMAGGLWAFCGIVKNGTEGASDQLWCAGYNHNGQMGTGSDAIHAGGVVDY